jgi:hypothetical protein
MFEMIRLADESGQVSPKTAAALQRCESIKIEPFTQFAAITNDKKYRKASRQIVKVTVPATTQDVLAGQALPTSKSADQ